jgi:hypothetical protein
MGSYSDWTSCGANFPDAEQRIHGWADGARNSLLDISTPMRRAGRRCAGHRPAGRSGDVTPPLEALGDGEVGQSPREEAKGLLMRMVV